MRIIQSVTLLGFDDDNRPSKINITFTDGATTTSSFEPHAIERAVVADVFNPHAEHDDFLIHVKVSTQADHNAFENEIAAAAKTPYRVCDKCDAVVSSEPDAEHECPTPQLPAES